MVFVLLWRRKLSKAKITLFTKQLDTFEYVSWTRICWECDPMSRGPIQLFFATSMDCPRLRGCSAANHNRLPQQLLSICRYIFFIPSIAIYLLLIERAIRLLIKTPANSVDQQVFKDKTLPQFSNYWTLFNNGSLGVERKKYLSTTILLASDMPMYFIHLIDKSSHLRKNVPKLGASTSWLSGFEKFS